MFRILAAVVVATAVAGGCGNGGSSDANTEEGLRAAVRSQVELFVKSPAKTYDSLSQRCKDNLTRSDWAGEVLMASALFEGFLGFSLSETTVGSVDVISLDGNRGEVRVELLDPDGNLIGDDADEPAVYLYEGGRWLSDDCDTFDVDGSPSDETDIVEADEAAGEPPRQLAVGDRGETDAGNFIQIFTYEQPVQPPDEWSTPDAGYEFVAIDVEVCAGEADDTSGFRSVNPYDFELHMRDNTRVQADLSVREPALHHVDLPYAGDCARGWVTFQAPEGENPRYVENTSTAPRLRWILP